MSRELGRKVVEARTLAGYANQDDFARAIGARQATVSAWEAGQSEPSAQYLRKIAEACGVSVDWLLDVSIDRDTDAEHVLRAIRKLVARNAEPSNDKHTYPHSPPAEEDKHGSDPPAALAA